MLDSFDAVNAIFWNWLGRWPIVSQNEDGKTIGRHAESLMKDVWPSVSELCMHLDVAGLGDVARRIDAAFKDMRELTRQVDSYCDSPAFDADAWYSGDADGQTWPDYPDASPDVADDRLIA